MIAWIILGVIVCLVTVIMLIPVGADVAYEDGELRLSAKACGLLIQILPKTAPDEDKPKMPKKEKKPKKEKPATAEKPKKERKLNFSKDEILSLVQKVLKKFGRFGRKFNVDRFLLHYVAAGKDPYQTAVNFAYVNSALSVLAPICDERFQVTDCEVWTDIDFSREKMLIDFGLAFSIRIGAFFSLAFGIAFSALGILIRSKLRLWREKKAAKQIAAETSAELMPTAEETNQMIDENIQSEERNDING